MQSLKLYHFCSQGRFLLRGRSFCFAFRTKGRPVHSEPNGIKPRRFRPWQMHQQQSRVGHAQLLVGRAYPQQRTIAATPAAVPPVQNIRHCNHLLTQDGKLGPLNDIRPPLASTATRYVTTGTYQHKMNKSFPANDQSTKFAHIIHDHKHSTGLAAGEIVLRAETLSTPTLARYAPEPPSLHLHPSVHALITAEQTSTSHRVTAEHKSIPHSISSTMSPTSARHSVCQTPID